MSAIKAGDVVKLKSGGAAMTVEAVGDGEAYCTWFDGSTPCSRNIHVVALMLASEAAAATTSGLSKLAGMG